MPLVQQAKEEDIAPYGVQPNDNTMTFHERLMHLFQPQEFVTVKNVDDETFIWQFMPPESENIEYTPDPMKITHRGDPEVWMIEPGQTETIVGANAYLMIEGLYKKLVAKKRFTTAGIKNPEDPHQPINFSFSDGEQQDRIIRQIYKGKAQPIFAPVEDKVETPKVEAHAITGQQTGNTPKKD